jgi:hypothetical protein
MRSNMQAYLNGFYPGDPAILPVTPRRSLLQNPRIPSTF